MWVDFLENFYIQVYNVFWISYEVKRYLHMLNVCLKILDKKGSFLLLFYILAPIAWTHFVNTYN